MTDTYDIAVDFMDMDDARRLWARSADVRADFEARPGAHAIVGDDGADPRVARIVSIDDDGNIELEVLPGGVEANRVFVARA